MRIVSLLCAVFFALSSGFTASAAQLVSRRVATHAVYLMQSARFTTLARMRPELRLLAVPRGAHRLTASGSSSTYSATAIGPAAAEEGQELLSPTAINVRRDIIGSNYPYSFVDRRSAVTLLSAAPDGIDHLSFASINRSGYAVGSGVYADYSPTQNARFALSVDPSNTISLLGTLPGDGASEAVAVNAFGTAIGTSGPRVGPNGSATVVLFRRGHVTKFAAAGTSPTDINDLGQAVGIDGNYNGVAYTPRGTVSLPLGGFPQLNDFGTIAGTASYVTRSGTTNEHAFTYAAGRLHDIGVPAGLDPDATFAQALAVNNLGEVLGEYYVEAGPQAGLTGNFLYSDGAVIDLMSLVPAGTNWTSIDASAFNDCGDIVGEARLPVTVDPGYVTTGNQGFLLHPLAASHPFERALFGCR